MLIMCAWLGKGEIILKTHARMQFAVVTGAVVLFAAPAWAQGPDGQGVYIGGGAGASRTTIDDHSAGINATLLSAGFSSPRTDTSKYEHSAAYKAFIGYNFNQYVALEAGYFNLGKFKFDTTVTPAGTLHGEAKSQGANLDAVFGYPLGQGFNVFGRIGIQNTQSKVALTGAGSVNVLTSSVSETRRGWKSGIGLGYEFAKNIGVRGEWEYYRIPDGTNTDTVAKVDVVGVSLYYRF